MERLLVEPNRTSGGPMSNIKQNIAATNAKIPESSGRCAQWAVRFAFVLGLALVVMPHTPAASQDPDTEKCAALWDLLIGDSVEKPPGLDKCDVQDDFRVGNSRVRVLIPEGYEVDDVGVYNQQIFPELAPGIRRAKKAGALQSKITVLYGRRGTAGQTSQGSSTGTTAECQVGLFPGDDAPQDDVKALVAHEIAHCVQSRLAPDVFDQDEISTNWWLEGTAEMIGARYVGASTQTTVGKYSADGPAQNFFRGEYRNWLFFDAYLQRTNKSEKWLFRQLARKVARVEPIKQQAKKFAKLPQMQDTFNEFLYDVTGEGYEATNGRTHIVARPAKQTHRIDPTNKSKLRVRPNLANVFALSIKGDAPAYKVTLKRPKTVVARWIESDSNKPGSLVGKSAVVCGGHTIEFLMSTVGPTSRNLTVSAKPLSEADAQNCEPECRWFSQASFRTPSMSPAFTENGLLNIHEAETDRTGSPCAFYWVEGKERTACGWNQVSDMGVYLDVTVIWADSAEEGSRALKARYKQAHDLATHPNSTNSRQRISGGATFHRSYVPQHGGDWDRDSPNLHGHDWWTMATIENSRWNQGSSQTQPFGYYISLSSSRKVLHFDTTDPDPDPAQACRAAASESTGVSYVFEYVHKPDATFHVVVSAGLASWQEQGQKMKDIMVDLRTILADES